jgi:hypothetical protein
MSRKGIEKQGTNVWAAAARDDALAYGPDWVSISTLWHVTYLQFFAAFQ